MHTIQHSKVENQLKPQTWRHYQYTYTKTTIKKLRLGGWCLIVPGIPASITLFHCVFDQICKRILKRLRQLYFLSDLHIQLQGVLCLLLLDSPCMARRNASAMAYEAALGTSQCFYTRPNLIDSYYVGEIFAFKLLQITSCEKIEAGEAGLSYVVPQIAAILGCTI